MNLRCGSDFFRLRRKLDSFTLSDLPLLLLILLCCTLNLADRQASLENLPLDVTVSYLKDQSLGAAAYQLGNTSSRTITEVKQR